MASSPPVALIVRTFNRAAVVSRAIDSALAQTHPAVSVLVVDDGSTDDTAVALERYAGDSRVRVVRHERNLGATSASNTGLAHISADAVYFGLLDSDDTLVPEAVAKLESVFAETGDRYSQVFGWCRDMHTGEATGSMSHREGLVTYDDALAGRLRGEFWQLARCDLLGGLRFDERASGGPSSVWWRMLRERPGWLVSDVVREYDRSGTDRLTIPRLTPGAAERKLWSLRAGLVAPIRRDMKAAHPGHYAELMAERAKWATLAGNGRQARAASREAVRASRSPRALLMMGVALLPPRPVRALVSAKHRLGRVISDVREQLA